MIDPTCHPLGWYALGFEDDLRDLPVHVPGFEGGLVIEAGATTPIVRHVPTGRTLECRWEASVLFAYYDPAFASPAFALPEMPWERETWTPFWHRILEVKTEPREVIENIVDEAHFAPVHMAHLDRFDVTFDGPRVTQETAAMAYGVHGGKDTFTNSATYHGPALLVSEMHGLAHSLMIASYHAISPQKIRLHLGVSFEAATAFPDQDEKQRKIYSDHYAATLIDGFLEDVAIWEHKIYRERPILCDGDGPIMKLRRWYLQFLRPELKVRAKAS